MSAPQLSGSPDSYIHGVLFGFSELWRPPFIPGRSYVLPEYGLLRSGCADITSYVRRTYVRRTYVQRTDCLCGQARLLLGYVRRTVYLV
jgi:hypothetical protein